MKRIYLDNAATTRLSDKALVEMKKAISFWPGNPSSPYAEGREAKWKLEEYRERCAFCLDCDPVEIIFTSGATEGNNIVLNNFLEPDGPVLVMSSEIEHPSARNVSFYQIPVNQDGMVSPSFGLAARTKCVSVMTANNEIGTIQPVREIAGFCRSKRIPFHTDATAAVGHIPVSFREIGADFLTCSAHKFHGPRGVGILVMKRNATILESLMIGGNQERGMRPGTENLPGIAGMTAALEEAVVHLEENAIKTKRLRDMLMDRLLEIEGTTLNGDRENRLPGNINISFDGIEGESLITLLDAKGIAASAGSACHTGTSKPSHVLTALGRTRREALSALRLTLNEENTEEEIDIAAAAIRESVEYLRQFTPKSNET